MFKHLRLKQAPHKFAPDPSAITVHELMGNYALPIAIRTLNGLPAEAKQRIYRTLIPPALLTRFRISPITWRGPDEGEYVRIVAEPDTGLVRLTAVEAANTTDPFFYIELADNTFNGIDLNLLLLNDPTAPRFRTDYDAEGRATLFGTVHRNLAEEERAMKAGLAPGQIRAGLSASQMVFQQLDAFLEFTGHQAVTLEPLTYASAWVFERRGCAYVRGHKLTEDVHREFQPGGRLYAALDGSTPFRQPEQWRTVRGRAWAIHDGILAAIDARWNDLRMVKQVGKHAGVNTFPDAVY